MQFQHAGTFVGRGTSGQHVVDQQNSHPAQVSAAFEGATHVFTPFLGRQFGLGSGWPRAHQNATVGPKKEAISKFAGNFRGLVEAALTQAFRVQGQGQGEVEALGGEVFRQSLPAPLGDCQLMAVFQGMDDAVGREVVAKEGYRPVEMGWILQAGAAAFTVRGTVGANRAASLRQRRQVGDTQLAKQFAGTVSAAQQATGREQRIAEAPGKSLEAIGVG